MGNCQVTEAAALMIQHPGGRVERLYWPTSASEVMKNHPGLHVALLTLYAPEAGKQQHGASAAAASVRLTRVRLLKPKDTLLLGQVYRLVTSQEVMKAIQARKDEKMKERQAKLMEMQQQQQQQQRIGADDHGDGVQVIKDGREKVSENTDLVAKQERDQHKSTRHSAGKPRPWRPSLQSIAEIGS